jgi:hypothetical protein
MFQRDCREPHSSSGGALSPFASLMSFFDVPDNDNGAIGERGLSETFAGDWGTLPKPMTVNLGDSNGLLPGGPGLLGGNMLENDRENRTQSRISQSLAVANHVLPWHSLIVR